MVYNKLAYRYRHYLPVWRSSLITNCSTTLICHTIKSKISTTHLSGSTINNYPQQLYPPHLNHGTINSSTSSYLTYSTISCSTPPHLTHAQHYPPTSLSIHAQQYQQLYSSSPHPRTVLSTHGTIYPYTALSAALLLLISPTHGTIHARYYQ